MTGLSIPVRAARIERSADRRITFGGLAIAAAFLLLAVASVALPADLRRGAWVPAHLVLAGAAATAIASVLPFFTAALVVAPPVRPLVRVLAIGGVASGALGVVLTFGGAVTSSLAGATAGGLFLAGIALTTVGAFAPVRRALGPRRRLVERAYALALVNVSVGAVLATLLLAGNGSVVGAWGSLKPAHAWLNLIGFACLVIVATLVHLAPTVAGTRMRAHATARLAIVGLAGGAPIVAAGYAFGLDPVARLGAAAVLAAAAGVVGHGLVVHREPAPGTWTTDAGWHRVTSLSLLFGQCWFGLGLGLAAARTLVDGSDPAGWMLVVVVAPLVIGGVAQILVGAMTHLLPAIGPGDPVRHAAQRRLLGTGATARIAAVNVGAGLAAVGLSSGIAPAWLTGTGDGPGWLGGVGLALAGLGIAGSVVLLAVAAATRRTPPRAGALGTG